MLSIITKEKDDAAACNVVGCPTQSEAFAALSCSALIIAHCFSDLPRAVVAALIADAVAQALAREEDPITPLEVGEDDE